MTENDFNLNFFVKIIERIIEKLTSLQIFIVIMTIILLYFIDSELTRIKTSTDIGSNIINYGFLIFFCAYISIALYLVCKKDKIDECNNALADVNANNNLSIDTNLNFLYWRNISNWINHKKAVLFIVVGFFLSALLLFLVDLSLYKYMKTQNSIPLYESYPKLCTFCSDKQKIEEELRHLRTERFEPSACNSLIRKAKDDCSLGKFSDAKNSYEQALAISCPDNEISEGLELLKLNPPKCIN